MPTPTSGAANSPIGVYRLAAYVSAEKGDRSAELKFLAELGVSMTIELRDDYAGTIDLLDEIQELTWDDREIIVDSIAVPYVYDGRNITLAKNGTTMVFVGEDGAYEPGTNAISRLWEEFAREPDELPE